MIAGVLTDRALNRALLARQGLLSRRVAPALDVVEQLVGLQAQVPSNPYVALWARLEGFEPSELSDAVADGRALRAAVIRPTVHLVTRADAQRLAPLNAPVLAAAFGPPWGSKLTRVGVDPAAVAAAGRALLDAGPLTRAQLAAELGPRWPDAPADALAQAVTALNPVYQLPPRGQWRASAQATWAPIPQPHAEADLDALIPRYLAAFGPATPADMRTWSRLTDLRPAFERLRGELRTFRDERGRELFDIPDGPLPDPDTPAPPRLLPEYDNVLLSHDDRTRIVAADRPAPRGTWVGHVLVDGFRAGVWTAKDGVLRIEGTPHTDELEAEATALIDLIAPGATLAFD
jgi:hypothetical protein